MEGVENEQPASGLTPLARVLLQAAEDTEGEQDQHLRMSISTNPKVLC